MEEKDMQYPAGAQDAGTAPEAGGKGAGEKGSSHSRDTSSKAVFGNPVLCAQFLRDNFDVPALKGVRPEDIEDISERYLPYLGTELEADSVEKVRILDVGKGRKGSPALLRLPHRA